jgi:hypothetical protein
LDVKLVETLAAGGFIEKNETVILVGQQGHCSERCHVAG